MEIYTNCRGYLRDGRPFDGALDGWNWQAWSGDKIAYGATEEGAVNHLRTKIDPSSAPAVVLSGKELEYFALWLDALPLAERPAFPDAQRAFMHIVDFVMEGRHRVPEK